MENPGTTYGSKGGKSTKISGKPIEDIEDIGQSRKILWKALETPCFSRHLQEDPDVFSLNSVFEAPHVCEFTFPNMFLVN